MSQRCSFGWKRWTFYNFQREKYKNKYKVEKYPPFSPLYYDTPAVSLIRKNLYIRFLPLILNEFSIIQK